MLLGDVYFEMFTRSFPMIATSLREQHFEFRFLGLERKVGYVNLLIYRFAPQIPLFAETFGAQ